MNDIDRARARDRDRAREQKKPLLRPLSLTSPLSDISLSDFVARVLFLWVSVSLSLSVSRERAGNKKREGGRGTKGKKKREGAID